MLETDKNISVEILLNKVISFEEIDLEVSSRKLSLFVKDIYKLNLDFKYLIDNDNMKAKWSKKEKKLKLNLDRL